MAMTPEDKKLLAHHIKGIAKILYKNTPPEKLETLEGIETAVRDQVLEHVSPQITFFYRRKDRNRIWAHPNDKKLCWSDKNHSKTSVTFRN
jgi:hypothetical protein